MKTPIPPLIWADKPIGLYRPPFCIVSGVVLVWKSELSNEVHQSLRLNGCLRVVLDVELAKLDCPLDHSPCCLRLVHGLLDGLVHHYQDGVRLKIRSQLTRSYYQRERNLLNSWVLGFYPLESLANVVN